MDVVIAYDLLSSVDYYRTNQYVLVEIGNYQWNDKQWKQKCHISKTINIEKNKIKTNKRPSSMFFSVFLPW